LCALVLPVTLSAAIVGGMSCWWLGEARIADERESLLESIRANGGDYQPFVKGGPSFSFVRRWLNDRAITTIWLPKPDDGLTAEKIKVAFPEAQLLRR
jgi:hypothetical protein